MTDFTYHNPPQVCPCCCKRQIPFLFRAEQYSAACPARPRPFFPRRRCDLESLLLALSPQSASEPSRVRLGPAVFLACWCSGHEQIGKVLLYF